MKTRNFITIIILIFTSLTKAGDVYVVKHPYEADIKIFVTKYPWDAELFVYVVQQSYEASNRDDLWNYVNYEYQADIKIYFVDEHFKSDLKIFFVDKKYKAGWNKPSKFMERIN